MAGQTSNFTALILAADRSSGDPVAEATGAPCKSLSPVGGIPMVIRVIEALEASNEVDSCILCGPSREIINQSPALSQALSRNSIRWIAHRETPSTSTYEALQHIDQGKPVLVTTADHALLTPQIVDYFCSQARNTDNDLAVGLASYEMLSEAFPNCRRTVTKLKDGSFCSCNLFAFLTPKSYSAANFWRQVEQQRKKPLRIVSVCGWITVLRFLLGQLTIKEGLRRISRRMGLKAGAIMMIQPEAAVDVDTVEDLALANKIIADRNNDYSGS
ncbi:MAG: nucleotidyltransferase family protein [Pseudomonadota bacterium]|nr:nucleotidyltransferase family protein [Pseudomonadota bacterium]